MRVHFRCRSVEPGRHLERPRCRVEPRVMTLVVVFAVVSDMKRMSPINLVAGRAYGEIAVAGFRGTFLIRLQAVPFVSAFRP